MKMPERPDTPFPQHWLRYVVLKFAVLAGGVLLAMYLAGWF